jgi:hypothetical protein
VPGMWDAHRLIRQRRKSMDETRSRYLDLGTLVAAYLISLAQRLDRQMAVRPRLAQLLARGQANDGDQQGCIDLNSGRRYMDSVHAFDSMTAIAVHARVENTCVYLHCTY